MILAWSCSSESYSLKSGWSKSIAPPSYIPTKMLSPVYSTPFSQSQSALSFCNAFSHSSEFCKLEMFTASRPLSLERAGSRGMSIALMFRFLLRHCSESFAIEATRNPRATPMSLPPHVWIVETHSLIEMSSQQRILVSKSVRAETSW